jgi:hypothetical protein
MALNSDTRMVTHATYHDPLSIQCMVRRFPEDRELLPLRPLSRTPSRKPKQEPSTLTRPNGSRQVDGTTTTRTIDELPCSGDNSFDPFATRMGADETHLQAAVPDVARGDPILQGTRNHVITCIQMHTSNKICFGNESTDLLTYVPSSPLV